MRIVTETGQCVEQIRKNMVAAGCSETEILSAISEYHKLSGQKKVEIAVLA